MSRDPGSSAGENGRFVWRAGRCRRDSPPRASQRGLFSLIELLPAALKEAAHDVPGLAHFRVVLVEGLAVVEDQKRVSRELLGAGVPAGEATL